jgi:hypothetical protein
MASDDVFQIPTAHEAVRTPVEAFYLFKQSPFYSPECNNEDASIPLNDMGHQLLEQMRGFEYDIDMEASQPPDLWIIRYQYRKTAKTAELLRAYYMLYGKIYRAPQALWLVESRLSKANFHIAQALQALTAFKPKAGLGDDENQLTGQGLGLSPALQQVPRQHNGVRPATHAAQ